MADEAPSRIIPVPDPSLLTTEALLKEIAHLKELIEGKFDTRQMLLEDKDRLVEQRFESQRNIMDEVNLRNQQRFDAQTKALDAAFLSAQTAVQAALSAADKGIQAAMTASEKAVSKAEIAAEKRFDTIMEFQKGFNDALALNIPRKEAETRLDSLSDKIDTRLSDMSVKIDDLKSFAAGSRPGGMQGGIAYVVGGIGLLTAIVVIVIGITTRSAMTAPSTLAPSMLPQNSAVEYNSRRIDELQSRLDEANKRLLDAANAVANTANSAGRVQPTPQ